MHRTEINLSTEYLCTNMLYHLNTAALNTEVWYNIYNEKIKNEKESLYKINKDYWEGEYYYYNYSPKVRELASLLVDFNMSSMFMYLVEIKKHKIVNALGILNILPIWYMHALRHGKNRWSHKDSSSCYKHILITPRYY